MFASMGAVYFEYRDSRKARFLAPLLEEFQGVLISDFFTGLPEVPPTEMSNTSDTRYE